MRFSEGLAARPTIILRMPLPRRAPVAAAAAQAFIRGWAGTTASELPAAEGRRPFVLAVNVGTDIEASSEFSRNVGTCTPFPDQRFHRLTLAELAKFEVQERLRRLWREPDSLNPARRR